LIWLGQIAPVHAEPFQNEPFCGTFTLAERAR